MMEDSGTRKLQSILKRLAQAVHGAFVNADEVKTCIDELREDGWTAVLHLEASLVCRPSGTSSEGPRVHLHVEPEETAIRYRLDVRDAELLSSLGISPSRHQARPSMRRQEADSE
jgi:hypothetical protein